LICNAGTWQDQTDFQKRMGLIPYLECFILVDLNNLKRASLNYA